MNKVHDYIIIGGGLSGLYLGYMLNKYNKNFIILEKKPRLGGRIKTVKKECFSYDAGAVRIGKNHKELLKLVKELNLNDQLVELSNKKVYHINNKFSNGKNNELNEIVKKGTKLNKKYRICNTFKGIGEMVSTHEKTNLAIIKTGYDSEALKLNFNDFLKETKTYETKYFKFRDGLSKLINVLSCKIGLDKIFMSSYVDKIEYKNKIIYLKTNNKVLKCKKVILAIPKIDLLKFNILNDHNLLINSVAQNNYIRIYAKYPKINNKYWFEDLDTIITDKPIRKIIPVDKKNGLIQISYCDNHYAEIFNNYNMCDKMYNLVEKNLKEIFKNIKIPKPTYLRAHYWDYGTHWWLPQVDSSKTMEEIIQPDDKIPLYIIGEAYSDHQAWMEGCITSANKLLKRLNINNQKGGKKYKKYSLSEVKKHNKRNDAWVIYKKGVYDITKWIPLHPGGNVILYGLGKDITKMFENVGHSVFAHNKLKSLKIGHI